MLNSVQALRAIAAWLVVFHHFVQFFCNTQFQSSLPNFFRNFGALGVDLFFCISGFVIYISYQRKPVSVLSFIQLRALRIIPAYWAFSIITAIIIITLPGFVPLTEFEYSFFFKSLLFIPALNPSGVGFFPLLTVGWTLNYEVFFYLTFSLGLFISARFKEFCIVLLIVVFVNFSKVAWGANAFFGNSIVYEFLLGILIAIIYAHPIFKKISQLVALMLIVLALFIIGCSGPITHNLLYAGVPCAILLCAGLVFESKFPKNSILINLGNWSYSTYLSHVLILSLILSFNRYLLMDRAACFVIAIIFILSVSYISYTFLESPVIKYSNRVRSSILSNQKL